MSSLSEFRERQDWVAKQLFELAKRLESEGLKTLARSLRDLAAECRKFVFRIAVIGTFSDGKSTLINALLEQEILPMDIGEVTLAPTYLRYGESPRGLIMRHEKPVEVIPLTQFKMITADEGFEGVEQLVAELPNELLRDGVEIVDTPGLDGPSGLHRLTLEFLPLAHAAILVVDVQKGELTATIRDFLKDEAAKPESAQRWMQRCFVAANKADILTQNLCDETLEKAKIKIGDRLDALLPPDGLAPYRRYFTSAKQALKRDSFAVGAHEVRRLKNDLLRFLLDHRGAAGWADQVHVALGLLAQTQDTLQREQERLQSADEAKRLDLDQMERRIEQERDRAGKLVRALRDESTRFAKDILQRFQDHCGALLYRLPSYLNNQVYPQRIHVLVKPAVTWFTDRATNWLDSSLQNWVNLETPQIVKAFAERFERAHHEDLQSYRDNLRAMALELGLDPARWPLLSEDSVLLGLIAIAAETKIWSELTKITVGAVTLGLGTLLAIYLAGGIGVIPLPSVAAMVVSAIVSLATAWFYNESRQDQLQQKLRDEIIKQLRTLLPTKLAEADGKIQEAGHRLIGEMAGHLQAASDNLLGQLRDTVEMQRKARNMTKDQCQAHAALVQNLQEQIAALRGAIAGAHAEGR